MSNPRDPIYELQRQRCKSCWNADGFDFTVPDYIWDKVVPYSLMDHVVCLACFDAFAHDAGVDYIPHIKELYFAGRIVGMKFVPSPH